jgi:multimeric flavodoxin WrbA
MPTALTIVVIVAGTNDPSNSDTLADAMIAGMQQSQPTAIINKVRLKDLSIGHFNIACYGNNCPIDDLTHVESMIQKAQGVVFATPIWNFGVPAHLKNLIDRMGSFALDEHRSIGTLEGKPFFLIFTAGMPKAAWPFLRKTVSGIGIAIQYFGGSVLGTHFEGGCTRGRGKFGLVVDKRPATLKRAKENGIIFARNVNAFAQTKSLPLRFRLIKKFVRVSQLLKRKLGM